jgi:hypothetical protein
VVLALTCVLVTGVLGGCSAFKSKKRVDMGGVAEDMIAVAGEIQYNLGQRRPVYLRGYHDTPQLVSLEYEAKRARMLVRGVIDYTIRLVTIGDSHRPESEKSSALADYLEDLLPAAIEETDLTLSLTRAQVDTVVANVRAQTTLLDALGAAQPVVDEVSITSRGIFDDTKTAMDAAVTALRQRIEDRFRDVRTADEKLERQQLVAVFGLDYLPQIRRGVPGALDSLLALEPSLPALVARTACSRFWREPEMSAISSNPTSSCTMNTRENWTSWRIFGTPRFGRRALRCWLGLGPTSSWPRVLPIQPRSMSWASPEARREGHYQHGEVSATDNLDVTVRTNPQLRRSALQRASIISRGCSQATS